MLRNDWREIPDPDYNAAEDDEQERGEYEVIRIHCNQRRTWHDY